MSDLLALMKRFRKAYARGDKEELLASTSDDFEWHQHAGSSSDLPSGRVLRGIEALLKEIAWRKEHWSEVTYSDLEERLAGDDLLVQTFRISGLEDGVAFSADAVDLYPVREGLITRKDTYWKYIK